ncbi:MAG TPA: SIS domain-containing protein [Bauldia sp.]|nr:SIS domain-containing protein [Bauldia sp.]
MLAEAREAPAAAARAIAANAGACQTLAARLRAKPPRFVVTCARGSSDSVATYASYLIELTLGIVTASVGPSVSSIYGARLDMRDTLFLAISQSGRSPDLLALTESAHRDGALTVAVLNDETSPLAALADVVLGVKAGPERSVAATKSYLASLATVLQFVTAWHGEDGLAEAVKSLPEALARAANADWQVGLPVLARATNLYVVGRGVGYAAAQEAALKLKETCGLHAEAISAAELMHGPLALAGPTFPVLAIGQNDAAVPALRQLLASVSMQEAPILTAAPGRDWPGTMLPVADGLHPFVQPIAAIQSFYGLVEMVARARGRDPDHPAHLHKVTETI